jgi:hypothetical protein
MHQIDGDAALLAVRAELGEQRILKIDAGAQFAGGGELGEGGG